MDYFDFLITCNVVTQPSFGKKVGEPVRESGRCVRRRSRFVLEPQTKHVPMRVFPVALFEDEPCNIATLK